MLDFFVEKNKYCVFSSKNEVLTYLYEKSLYEHDPNRKGELFEAVVRNIFSEIKCNKRLEHVNRQKGGDIDLVIKFYEDPSKCSLPFINGRIVIVEAKNWMNKINENIVAAFAQKLENRGIKTGIIVTSGSFTDRAVEIASRLLHKMIILLIDGEKLKKILHGSTIEEVLDEAYNDLLRYS